MPISVIFLDIVILLGIFLYMKYRKTGKIRKKTLSEFLEKENEANFARRKELGAEMYFVPDLSRLPFREYEQSEQNTNIMRRIKDAKEKSTKQMIHFEEEISNLDLKLKYGTSNLDFIAGCEENYRRFIISLNEWAQALLDAGMYGDAAIVMEEAIKMGSEMSKSFKILADSYRKEGEEQKLNDLLADIESRKYKFDNDTIVERIIHYLKNPEV